MCLLVMMGVRSDGRKELIALADGFRESTESWADLLRSCRLRGMTAPVLAVEDGALGFWKAMRDVWPGTRVQRRWFHKTQNILSALPKSAHPGVKAAIQEITITEDLDVPLEFLNFPARHRVHRRTTNPIESTFATVRLRTKTTKGPGSRAARMAKAFKLIESAERRWRTANAPHLVALVRAGGC